MDIYDTWKDIKVNTPLLSSVIIETLRFHSHPNSIRVVEKNCTISGDMSSIETIKDKKIFDGQVRS